MFLTQTELAELTERKRKGEQIAWLKANGYHYAIGANGHARVLREHLHARLCGVSMATAPAALEPNWGAM
ncbi:MAG TPA: DUF4224 domain-containing protein [Gallionellaceae bacterium]|nr:DUF4224 domain-containing protein [Gallionellaceae bacterium]